MNGHAELRKNKNIFTLCENKITTCKNIFNFFWKTNTNVIYIVDTDRRLTGVITEGDFLEQMKRDEQAAPFVNKNCSVIVNKEDGALYQEAEKLFKKYGIKTAIPVVDEDGKPCFELRKKEKEDEREIIVQFQEKIVKYEKSYYLREEIVCLRKLLEEQDIVVIGTEERFHYLFGKLILNKNRITYLESPDNAYEFMHNNEQLVLDLSERGFQGRETIHCLCNNGYCWKQFIQFVFKVVEGEYCSRFYQILENGFVTLQDFLKKYMSGPAFFSKRSIFTATIIKYLKEHDFSVIEQRGIYRTESFQYELRLNEIEMSRDMVDELETIEYVDIISQFYALNQKLSGKVRILNFVFDGKVDTTDAEAERLGSTDLEFSDRLYEYAGLYSLGKNKSTEYLRALSNSFQHNYLRTFENNLIVFKDRNSRYVNFENGIRKTCFQPEKYNGTIYFFGRCTIWGWLVEDQYTIPSLIQKYMNEEEEHYRVVNLGYSNLIKASNFLESLDIKENDIFVFFFPFLTDKVEKNISVLEIGERFNEIRKNKYGGIECFFDRTQHCGTNGTIIYSEIIFEELKKYLNRDKKGPLKRNYLYQVFRNNYKDLDALYGYDTYIEELKRGSRENGFDETEKIGCIVMNCNPFTLGHRYLVEQALCRVDYLYIFVVEEDKSYFSFTDRYEMVKRGTEDLNNVLVVKSGSMVASAVTFPVYFQKEKWIAKKERPSVGLDLRVFAQYIAPAVHIQYRFVGEEITDPVTIEYNKKMKEILPEFGVEVVEIPRKCIDGKAISASIVRECYKEGDFQKMQKWVPNTTLQYLFAKKYGDKQIG